MKFWIHDQKTKVLENSAPCYSPTSSHPIGHRATKVRNEGVINLKKDWCRSKVLESIKPYQVVVCTRGFAVWKSCNLCSSWSGFQKKEIFRSFLGLVLYCTLWTRIVSLKSDKTIRAAMRSGCRLRKFVYRLSDRPQPLNVHESTIRGPGFWGVDSSHRLGLISTHMVSLDYMERKWGKLPAWWRLYHYNMPKEWKCNDLQVLFSFDYPLFRRYQQRRKPLATHRRSPAISVQIIRMTLIGVTKIWGESP